MEARLLRIIGVKDGREVVERYRVLVSGLSIDRDVGKVTIHVRTSTGSYAPLEVPVARTGEGEFDGPYSFIMDLPVPAAYTRDGIDRVIGGEVYVDGSGVGLVEETVRVDISPIDTVRARIVVPSGYETVFAIPLTQNTIGERFRAPVVELGSGYLEIEFIPNLSEKYSTIAQVYVALGSGDQVTRHCVATVVASGSNQQRYVEIREGDGMVCSDEPPDVTVVDPMTGGSPINLFRLEVFDEWALQADVDDGVIRDLYESGWLSHHLYEVSGTLFNGIVDALKAVASSVDVYAALTTMNVFMRSYSAIAQTTPWHLVEKPTGDVDVFRLDTGFADLQSVTGFEQLSRLGRLIRRLIGLGRRASKRVGDVDDVLVPARRSANPPMSVIRPVNRAVLGRAGAHLLYRTSITARLISTMFPKVRSGLTAIARAGKFIVMSGLVLFTVKSISDAVKYITSTTQAAIETQRLALKMYDECVRRTGNARRCEGYLKFAEYVKQQGGGGILQWFRGLLGDVKFVLVVLAIVLVLLLLITRR